MHYVLFAPGSHGYDAGAVLRSLGLDALIDTFVIVGAADATVNDEPGKLIRWDDPSRPERNATPGVEDKTWWWDRERRFAIGWCDESPPTPDDLQRNAQYTDAPLLTSYPCRLSDGNIWLVPIARLVPRQWSQGPNGEPVLAPRGEYAWYFDAVRDVLAQCESGDINPDEPPAKCFLLAVRALGMAYRICPEVCYATGLFAPHHALTVLAAAAEHSLEFEARLQYEVRATNPILTQKKTAGLASTTAT